MKILRNILMICFSLLIYHPLYGKCSYIQIGKMVKMGLSEEEITEVCGKPTQSKPEEDKPKVPLKYSDKLGVRSNEGSLTTHLNPPKNSNTRFYFLYGQIVHSEENRKLESLHTLDTFKSSGKFVGIDNRLSEDNLHYVSLSYLSQNLNAHQRWREDDTLDSVNYYKRDFMKEILFLRL